MYILYCIFRIQHTSELLQVLLLLLLFCPAQCHVKHRTVWYIGKIILKVSIMAYDILVHAQLTGHYLLLYK